MPTLYYPYCPPANAGNFIDLRRLNQLLSDSDSGPLTSPLNSAVVLASPLLNVQLLLASNVIDGALLESRRYSNNSAGGDPTKFTDVLAAFAATNNGIILQELCAQLAFGKLLGRRQLTEPEQKAQQQNYQDALDRLELYRLGKLILPINDAKLDAGLPALVELGSGNNDPVLTTQRPWGDVDLVPTGPTPPQRNWASIDGGEERGDW